ncbi:Uncharacterized protein CLAVI_000019 [Candidatus Clavichlamydia salmonicola]|uniref:FAD-dependent oxidoreductase n=1 Tax=Candidatus Clavichlamydia salmonicola TaxID=469812 RepID=UPI0018919ADE|nr:FAD-dependent oxidoreductase [Candidatus Clavichlamydia salmonicola]MBF5050418.1 Uncharacterized protein [Candidatus Clavichlamydia salmonicola]
MRIAVIGSSYMGLSVAWNIINLSQGTATLDLFDSQSIDNSSSRPMIEILSPFLGENCEKSSLASAASDAVHRLIMAAQNPKYPSSILAHEILRLAETNTQISLFQKTATSFPGELEWLPQVECEKKYPYVSIPSNSGGLLIKNCVTIHSQNYLQSLLQACTVFNLQTYTDNFFSSLVDFQEYYDHIIITDGPEAFLFPEIQNLPLKKEKTKCMELTLNATLPSNPITILGKEYLFTCLDQKATYFFGSSCGINQLDLAINQVSTENAIWEQINPILPSLKSATMNSSSYEGTRLMTPYGFPLMGKTPSKLWFCLGSSGSEFFYHGMAGKIIASAILTNNLSYIPKQFLYSFPS